MVPFQNLCDAHCHPHDDKEKLAMIAELKTGHVTLMGVRQDDWDTVVQVCEQCPKNKCIPAFGEIMLKVLDPPFRRDEWYNNLLHHLETYPQAIVGEVGLDRAARLLPGGAIEWHGVKPTMVQCTIEHQLAVLALQLELARKLDRAVSLHCVQGQGHLLSLLQKTKQTKDQPVVRLCLHSYGGSPATIAQFMHLKAFRIYVSFSIAINARLDKKLDELIRAVPEDRLLIESDMNTPQGQDEAMAAIVERVAEARGWEVNETAEKTRDNWYNFIGIR
ncbi:TatD family [Dichotomocladium elegans]|nr:TatD family [Dichotomocladium elegans]